MRLRLTVQRNGLPAANILWSVPETNSTQAYTITRLLEDINHIIPLEAEHWGLEHYVVEIDGFECLHFSPVVQALKEDDHVSIRPLMTAEVRARTLTGRDQISGGGQHLVDGVPFGKPYLRHPNRPAVRIPPRKRRRLDDETVDGAGAVGLLTNGQVGDRPQQASRSVHFEQPEVNMSEDSEDDEDFAPGGDQDDDVSTSDDSNSDSEASSSASDTSDSDSGSDSDSSGGSDSDDESDASSPPDVLSSKDGSAKSTSKTPDSQKLVPPGEGCAATKQRNARRIRSNRLRRLKESGQLPPTATLGDLYEHEDAMKGLLPEPPVPAQPFSKPLGKRKRFDDNESAEVIEEVTDEVTNKVAGELAEKLANDTAGDLTELEARKQELIAKFGETSSITLPPDEPTQPQSPIAQPTIGSPSTPEIDEPPTKETPSRRLRPDTSAISRILARQARPATKKAKTKPKVQESPEPEGASDPEFWKSRINVSAFECWEEDFELSAPPFPFKQHWDPASQLMRDKATKKKQKKGGQREAPSAPLPEEEEEGEKIFLNYDDTPETDNPDSEINAAIEDQLRQDLATAAQSDLPPLPEDISALPDLTPSDMKVGAVVVFKFFAINPTTITPEISGFKTAIVEQEGDSGPGAGTIQLKIATRDLPKKEKKFDNKGNRVYEAADAFLVGDEETDESLWEGQFGELLEPKLLKAA